MYKNLRLALMSKNITMKAFSEFLGITEKTLQNKMNGVTEFTYDEVERTSRFLFPEYRIEYLFTKAVNEETDE